MSHQVRETFGMDHPIPDASMGKTALELNLCGQRSGKWSLRRQMRLKTKKTTMDHKGVKPVEQRSYVVFCRLLSGYYDRMEE